MNRADLQRLSNVRIRESKLLFEAREYSGGYYLARYAVECALKACFARSVRRYDFPDKEAGKIFTHKFSELVKLARLSSDLSKEEQTNSKFSAGWELVCKWTEESRYSVWTRDDAEAILNAIVRRTDGVLPWIRRRW